MSAAAAIPDRRFYRSADNARLGGVCAGFAEYFGLNLKVTRLLVIIAFFMAMPVTIVAYLAVVLLVPAKSFGAATAKVDPEFKRALRSTPRQTMSDVRSRFQSLDRRLAGLEKYVTSPRYELDREFQDLEYR